MLKTIKYSDSLELKKKSYRIESNRIVWYRIVSNRIVSNRIESNRIVSNRIVSNRIESYRIVYFLKSLKKKKQEIKLSSNTSNRRVL